MSDYVKVFSEIPLLVRRLKSILAEENIASITKSDKIVGYEISNNIDDLFVQESDLERASPIIESFKEEISIE